MKEVLNAYGENATKFIKMAIAECYAKLDGSDLLSGNEVQVRGRLQAYRYSLQAMGRDYEVEIKIVEYKK